jgi:hypothetical protein
MAYTPYSAVRGSNFADVTDDRLDYIETEVAARVAALEAADAALVDAWTAYTPTTGITLGTGGTKSGAFRVEHTGATGYVMDLKFSVTIGSSGHSLATPTFELPATYTATVSAAVFGHLDDGGAAWLPIFGVIEAASNSVALKAIAGTALSNSVPITWASGDKLYIQSRLQVTYTAP